MTVYALGEKAPLLGAEVWIAPSATVIGDVVLGAQSSVWFGALVRGDVFPIRIGARTNLQDNAIVHVTGGKSATRIGDDVTVGHAAIVHGCTVGDRCLIGMGAIVLDDAVIEDDCIVAAGALVPPRAVIPRGSLVIGRPAKVQRAVTDADRAAIAEAALHYVANAARFATSLRPI